jgi:DNA-binding NarL/FixJ family response regulator
VSDAIPLIRVVVVDDQAIVREGLVTVLSLLPDVDVVGEAADGAAAVDIVARLAPDVVLMDLRMPVLGGLEATRRIAAANPAIGILILTTFADEASALDVLHAGARGYLTKDAGRAEVAAAVRAVAQGHTTLGADVGTALFAQSASARVEPDYRVAPGSRVAPAARVDPSSRVEPAATEPALAARFNLTPRESDVLDLIAEGLSNPEIAARLFVSVATVKTHINSIFPKLGVRDRAKAIALVHQSAATR